MVYGRYNYSIHGVYKPTNITGGHHPVLLFSASIYQLFWCSLGTRVLTHPHIIIFCAWRRRPSSPHARAECCHRCQARLLGPARCGTELSHQGSPRVTEFTIKRGRWSQKHLEKPWKILVGEKVNSKLYLGKLWRPHCGLSGMMIYANLQ